MAGFIYIMSNPAFPNLLKIGKSKKDPTTDRVNELNQTGVPEPFKVEYYAFVEDEDYLERVVHQRFASQRPNKNREFFSVECVEAIDAIRQLSEVKAKIKYEEVFYVSQEAVEHHRKKQELARRENDERIRAENDFKQMQQVIERRVDLATSKLERLGNDSLHDALDKYYPEDASAEGKVQWGKVALFAAFPPVAFYWGNRAQRRFNDIKSEKYKLILSNAKRRVRELSQMQYSKDWEKVLDVELARIERDFKSETVTYINHYFQALNHSK